MGKPFIPIPLHPSLRDRFSPGTVIPVCAHTHAKARFWATMHGMHARDWRYVSPATPASYLALRGHTVVVIGDEIAGVHLVQMRQRGIVLVTGEGGLL